MATMTIQKKIAELEMRIIALEKTAVRQSPGPAATTTTRTATVTASSGPMSVAEQGHWDAMWKHFSSVFDELGKVFR